MTERVFAEIARARPPRLLVVADGPRADRPGELDACHAARAVIERVDWDCEVLTNFAETNMGCRRRVSSGLTWVFEQVEEAIILEDDCLPHPSFFPYCEELLERFRDDERVMMISGDNFQFGRRRTPYSYYFSRGTTDIWGWASWRRAWRLYDAGMRLWPELRDAGWLKDLLRDDDMVGYWRETFEKTYAGHDTWDYQWTFSIWAQNGLAAIPNVNLVSNIGWGQRATHTSSADSPLGHLPAGEMRFPLEHPPHVWRHGEADRFAFERKCLWYGYEPTLYRRLHRKFFGLFPPSVHRSLSRLRARPSRPATAAVQTPQTTSRPSE